MIIGKTFFKRDAVLHARIPSEIKMAFQNLAENKGISASEYLLKLVLQELHVEKADQDLFAPKKKKTFSYD